MMRVAEVSPPPADCDGLGFKELAQAPRLRGLYETYGTWITSVFPSITSCALSSMFQGLPPNRHGILGHYIWKDFPGAVVGRQFQHLIGRTQPVSCRNLAAFDLLQEFIQKRADTGQQNFQVCHVVTFFLWHAGNQFQFAGHR